MLKQKEMLFWEELGIMSCRCRSKELTSYNFNIVQLVTSQRQDVNIKVSKCLKILHNFSFLHSACNKTYVGEVGGGWYGLKVPR